jgi:YggT family protein
MNTLAALVYYVFWLYLLVLIGRLVFDYVRMFARDWRPRGAVLVLAEMIYALTDPPLRVLRRFIPPLRLGGISLDLSFLALFFGVSILMRVIPALLIS